jgi:putative ABC transport system substrate-binding protein
LAEGISMRRRQFITLLGGTTLALPFVVRAEQAARIYRIGILDINSAEYSVSYIAAFRDGLGRLGYIEGQNTHIDYRSSNGNTKALTDLARDLVALKPDVVLANSVSPVRAAKSIAAALPIVCPAFGDAFIPNLATSFAHPGGNVTGIAANVEGLFGKLTELALDALPGVSKIGFLANPAGASTKAFENQIRSTAEVRGIEVHTEAVATINDFEAAFQRFTSESVQAVIVPSNGLLHAGQNRIVELARSARLPLIFTDRANVEAGGFVSYGVSLSENYRRAALYVDKILKGAAPGDLPIEFPTKIELVISLKTARELGLTVPPTLLARADEVIE